MKPIFRRRAYVFLTSAVMICAGCGGEGQTGPSHSLGQQAPTPFEGEYPIQVVATTGPVADMLRSLGGEHLKVTGLMGPGVDPHLYTAVVSDIEQLAAADAIFYNGLHLEGRMAETIENLGRRKPVFAVTQSLVESEDKRLRKPPDFEGYYDPHVWHDAQLWGDCAKYVADLLHEFDPNHRDAYAKNLQAYQAELREAHQYAADELSRIPEEQRALVTAHDAFGYFCLAYGLEPMPLKGVSTEEEVSIGRMDEVIEFLVDRKVKAVFVETAVAPRIVKALIEPCEELGHAVVIGGELYADALGPSGSEADTTPGMIRANVDTIVSALAGSSPQSETE
jgi:manganese/zinc/iron transport system substrate-binding protein